MTERSTDKLLDKINKLLGEHDARVVNESLREPDDGEIWGTRSLRLRGLGAAALPFPRFSDEHASDATPDTDPADTSD